MAYALVRADPKIPHPWDSEGLSTSTPPDQMTGAPSICRLHASGFPAKAP
jgi:hypothetical protein